MNWNMYLTAGLGELESSIYPLIIPSSSLESSKERKMRSISLKKRELGHGNGEVDPHEVDSGVIDESDTFKSRKLARHKPQEALSVFKNQRRESKSLDLEGIVDDDLGKKANGEQLDTAATKLQKVYKSYRTRRNLADCAVVIEELWWKELDSAALRRSSVSFFNAEKSETAVSKWKRARIRAAKVGKGLSKDEKAQELALRHWLEAIDPRHRYGHNLHLYYDVWFESGTNQPFFYWLDIGDGKEVNLEKCSRTVLQCQCIKYLGPKEREAYEVVVENGKLLYKQARVFVDTPASCKWIFVLSTSRNLYVGEKKKGLFQHSSFLSGGATIASGRLVAHNGILEAIWPFSGHYRPTEENFIEFCSFLKYHHVDLTNVKKFAIDDDIPPESRDKNIKPESKPDKDSENNSSATNPEATIAAAFTRDDEKLNNNSSRTVNVEESAAGFELNKPLSRKWTTGAGPRISCVRDYPTQLQFHALEQVNLSPRIKPGAGPFTGCGGPLPSPRPTANIHLSPRLSLIALPSPRNIIHLSAANRP